MDQEPLEERLMTRVKRLGPASCHETGEHAVVARRVRAVAVGGKTLGEIEPGRANGDRIEDGGSDDGADDLGHDVGQDVLPREASACRQAHGDRRIEVAT